MIFGYVILNFKRESESPIFPLILFCFRRVGDALCKYLAFISPSFSDILVIKLRIADVISQGGFMMVSFDTIKDMVFLFSGRRNVCSQHDCDLQYCTTAIIHHNPVPIYGCLLKKFTFVSSNGNTAFQKLLVH